MSQLDQSARPLQRSERVLLLMTPEERTQQILRRFQESFETESGSYDGVQLQAQAGASGAGARLARPSETLRPRELSHKGLSSECSPSSRASMTSNQCCPSSGAPTTKFGPWLLRKVVLRSIIEIINGYDNFLREPRRMWRAASRQELNALFESKIRDSASVGG